MGFAGEGNIVFSLFFNFLESNILFTVYFRYGMRYMARVLKAALEKKFPEAAEKDVLKVIQINFTETRICASYTQSIVLKINILLS